MPEIVKMLIGWGIQIDVGFVAVISYFIYGTDSRNLLSPDAKIISQTRVYPFLLPFSPQIVQGSG